MSELVIGAAAVAILDLLVGWLVRAWCRQASIEERRSRPSALRKPKLVCIEKTFRTTSSVPIAAKFDRACRLPSGLLVLMDLKIRRTNKPSFSDVIQLSAQRAALSGATGQTLAVEAFVLIPRAGIWRSCLAHGVALLSAEQVVTSVRRREASLSSRVSPCHALQASRYHLRTSRRERDGADLPRRQTAVR